MNNDHHHLALILSVFVSYVCYCEDNYLLLCEGQRKIVTCPNDTTIYVLSAIYGYSASNVEAREECYGLLNKFLDLESTTCHHPPSTDIVSDICNGLSECAVTASNEIFGDPCPGVIKYLEVYYNCSQLSVDREEYVTTCLPNEKNSRDEDGVIHSHDGSENNENGDEELKNDTSKGIDNGDADSVGLSPVSVVSVVAVSAGVLVAFIAMIFFVGSVFFLLNKRRCIFTKYKKSHREKFESNNTRENHNTSSLNMDYEVVGNNENTPKIDSANQLPHYERSLHVTSYNFEYDYADETITVRYNEPQGSYLNTK